MERTKAEGTKPLPLPTFHLPFSLPLPPFNPPHPFQVLDAENESIIESTEAYKGTMTSLMKKGAKARHFNASIPKVDGHLRRIGDANDRERARLWGDLAKV